MCCWSRVRVVFEVLFAATCIVKEQISHDSYRVGANLLYFGQHLVLERNKYFINLKVLPSALTTLICYSFFVQKLRIL